MIPAFYRLLPVLALAGALWGALWLGLALPVAAQTGAAEAPPRLPAWVVPTLRLVSATHVEPTTGVVLSDSGLVLVPLAFGDAGDEIVVLDGGTDIVRNGRPARLERAFPELGLKVLAVEGLSRAGARLSADVLADGSAVTLAAFPPAERIEEGAPPLHESAVLRTGPAGDGLLAETALPNVSGAVLDACGRLTGYSIADGVQTVAPAAGTQYRWRPALQTVLDGLGLESTGLPCVAADAAAADAAEEVAKEVAKEVTEEVAEEPTQESVAEPPAEEAAPPEQPEEEAPPDLLPPIESGNPQPAARTAPPAEEEQPGGTAWWLGAALLLFAAGLAIHRVRTRPAAAPPSVLESTGAAAPPADPAGDEDAATAPGDGRLLLRGQYADGRPLLAAAPVSSRAIHLEIGRGNADLALDSPAVSRRHARLGGTAAALMLADLGSSNGSSINGVPCLEGEVMYVEPGDTVILGDVRFVIEFEPQGEPGFESANGGSAAP